MEARHCLTVYTPNTILEALRHQPSILVTSSIKVPSPAASPWHNTLSNEKKHLRLAFAYKFKATEGGQLFIS